MKIPGRTIESVSIILNFKEIPTFSRRHYIHYVLAALTHQKIVSLLK